MQTRLPAPDRTRAAARPAAPAPTIATSNFTLLFDDLTPGQLPDQLHLLVDLRLGGAVAEDAAEVVDFRRYELVVLRKEAAGRALKVALRYRDLLRDSFALLVHDDFPTHEACRNHPIACRSPFARIHCDLFGNHAGRTADAAAKGQRVLHEGLPLRSAAAQRAPKPVDMCRS